MNALIINIIINIIERNKLTFYVLISLIYFYYSIKTNTLYLDDTSRNNPNELNGRVYQPYNPNYVETTEGYKV